MLGCLLATVLMLQGCARHHENYSPPPSTINETANAGAITLRDMARPPENFTPLTDAYSYRIGPNDVIEIKVFEQPNMNITTRVGGNGMINFPPLGDILAAGRSERQLETLLQDRLRGAYLQNPSVTVFVREVQARMVGIIGAVNLPGQYSSFGPMRLADLIAKAGGLKPEAGEVAYVMQYKPERGVTVITPQALQERQDTSETIKVDLDGLLRRGDPVWNVELAANNLVNIPSAGSVFITGLGIGKPGTYPLTPRMTLQQLVDLAEGLKYEANHRILLVRTALDGAKSVYTVNYDQLRAQRTTDIQLQSGDKVIVDRTPVKTVVAVVGRGIARVVRVLISADYNVSNDSDGSND